MLVVRLLQCPLKRSKVIHDVNVEISNSEMTEKDGPRRLYRKQAPSEVLHIYTTNSPCSIPAVARRGYGADERSESAESEIHCLRKLFDCRAVGTRNGATCMSHIDAIRKRYGGSQSKASKAARLRSPLTT